MSLKCNYLDTRTEDQNMFAVNQIEPASSIIGEFTMNSLHKCA